MKILSTIFFAALLATGSYAQAPTQYEIEDSANDDQTFTVSIIFDAAGGPAKVENNTFGIFIPEGSSTREITSLASGGNYEINQFLTNDQLTGLPCGGGGTFEGYEFIAITDLGSSDVGTVSAGVPEFLAEISISGGTFDSNQQLVPYDPTGADPMSACLGMFGIDNTASIEIGGNTEPYSNLGGGQSIILPIKLSSFDASKHTENSTLLQWESTSEVNASHYVVQRSTDKQVWDNIGQVKTKGDQFTAASYEMLDNNVSNTRTNDIVYFYRLQMVDLDGYTEYSEVEAVRFDGIEHSGLFIFPNPTVDEVYVTIDNVATLGGTMTVVDRNGATIKTQKLANGQDERISLRELPSGLYHMSVIQNDNVYSQKVIKID